MLAMLIFQRSHGYTFTPLKKKIISIRSHFYFIPHTFSHRKKCFNYNISNNVHHFIIYVNIWLVEYLLLPRTYRETFTMGWRREWICPEICFALKMYNSFILLFPTSSPVRLFMLPTINSCLIHYFPIRQNFNAFYERRPKKLTFYCPRKHSSSYLDKGPLLIELIRSTRYFLIIIRILV